MKPLADTLKLPFFGALSSRGWLLCAAALGLALMAPALPLPAAGLALALLLSLPAIGPRRVLVLGAGEEAAAVERALRQGSNMTLIGCYPLGPEIASGAPLLSSAVSLERTARDLRITDIVVAVGDRRGGRLPQEALLQCRLQGVRVFDLSSFFERHQGQLRLDALRAGWLIYGEGFRQGGLRRVFKRLFDLLFASMLLAVAAPLMLLAALAIVLDSPGPVFYRQSRVGRGGQLFDVIKFRSMRVDAEGDGTPRWAAKRDARITRVGHLLRRYRVDELPQLWNVLKGEMSLVGPRPERPFFVSRLTHEVPFYALRHSVKPGLTGWAQVRYHYGESIHDAVQKLQYDLYYLKHHGLLLDLWILFSTVKVVLTGQGAH